MWSAVCFCALLSALCAFWAPCAQGQDLHERDALCNEEGCYVVYFQRKTFLESWRSCRERGGDLATMKRPEEAARIQELLSGVERRGPRARIRVWIGLQRQPRQCSATRPLRGFTWTTGDHDTQYTNWLREDSPSTCAVLRCVVVTHSTASQEQRDNFKWLDGSCSLPVDGFLCRFTYRGMCPAIPGEGGPGSVLYSTPFHLLSTLLTHVPFGSVATVPCPGDAREDPSVLCVLRDDGTVGWSRDSPLCSNAQAKSFCEQDNGGCQHLCRDDGPHSFCECFGGFRLAEDGQTCLQENPCREAPCEFECEPAEDGGYRCTCPDGYLLAPDGLACLDVDECEQSPCPQLCVNAPGTFECRCHHGYQPDDQGQCADVDECRGRPCEQACENTAGSYACHCHLGFSPAPEDPARCQDTDECQIPGSCEHMCVNYVGGFQCHCREGYELQQDYSSCRPVPSHDESTTAAPSFPWFTSLPESSWLPEAPGFPDWPPQLPEGDWPESTSPLTWLTDPPSLEGLPTDLTWLTDVTQEDPDRPEVETEPIWAEPDWTEAVEPTFTPSPSPASTAAPDWLEEETTPSPPATLTPTPEGGAWNFWRISTSSTAPEESVERGGVAPPSGEDAPSEFGDGSPVSWPQPTPKAEPDFVPEEVDGAAVDTDPLTPPAGTGAPPGGSDSSQQQSSSWLLVALLVPLSIFVVVMVALGIVYCTRCAVQPRNKKNNDCYHWISGAGDKPGAQATAQSGV
ncbi:CD248 molecule, endosialin a [Megalops cyprinoides]|uniref:CD248 molecule, endosialin a n=1 Tax=Megalops cyprinoides TaxID=118141 RepID=UPI001864E323|nr:CD248 molecule, endosialin a [Megalops cyprinoides]